MLVRFLRRGGGQWQAQVQAHKRLVVAAIFAAVLRDLRMIEDSRKSDPRISFADLRVSQSTFCPELELAKISDVTLMLGYGSDKDGLSMRFWDEQGTLGKVEGDLVGIPTVAASQREQPTLPALKLRGLVRAG